MGRGSRIFAVARAHGSEHSVTVRELDSEFLCLILKSNEKRKKDIEDKIIRSEVEKVKKRVEALEKELVRNKNETDRTFLINSSVSIGFQLFKRPFQLFKFSYDPIPIPVILFALPR